MEENSYPRKEEMPPINELSFHCRHQGEKKNQTPSNEEKVDYTDQKKTKETGRRKTMKPTTGSFRPSTKLTNLYTDSWGG